MINILFILPSLNLYGGTPRKTLDLIKNLDATSFVYTYDEQHYEHIKKFEDAGAIVITTNYKKNIFKHFTILKRLLISKDIHIVQTQFFMGELLGFICKKIKKNLKWVNSFVGVVGSNKLKQLCLNIIYKDVDQFVYVSNYVKSEKEKEFAVLKNSNSKVIYNGTEKRKMLLKNRFEKNKTALLTIGGLNNHKNISILIEMINIINKKDNKDSLHLYIIGDGPMKNDIISKIEEYNLADKISLLGYIEKVGDYLNNCDIYLHPAKNEGFGIAVAEAMHAEKAIIVSNKGGLIELIENDFSGMVVDANDPNEWEKAVLKIINDNNYKNYIAKNTKKIAEKRFSTKVFVKNYQSLYQKLING